MILNLEVVTNNESFWECYGNDQLFLTPEGQQMLETLMKEEKETGK